jgi:hypothetical protein
LGDWFAWLNIALLAVLTMLWNRGKSLTQPN